MNGETVARWFSIALSLAGLGLATYMSIGHLTGAGPACSVGGGCNDVTGSQYSVLLGVPVTFIGVAGYGALLLGNLARLELNRQPPYLVYGLLTLAVVGEGFSIYLTSAQAFILRAWCAYCLTSAAIMTSLLAATVAATVFYRRAQPGHVSG